MKRNGVLLLAWACLAIGAALPAAGADPPSGEAKVQAALAEMHRWTGEGATGQGWRKFLKSDVLSAELAKGAGANPQVIADVLAQYESGKPGLEMSRFKAVREALAAWSSSLPKVAPQDLAQAARDAAAKFQPVTPDQVAQSKAELAKAVSQLDQLLVRSGSDRATGWKNFLRWNDLSNLLQATEPPPDDAVVALIDQFRMNRTGLEMPQFLSVRTALENFAATRTAAADAKLQEQHSTALEDLAKQLEALTADPASGDASLAIGRTLGWLEQNRQAPELVGKCPPRLLAAELVRLCLAAIRRGRDRRHDRRSHASPRQHPRHQHPGHGPHAGPHDARPGRESPRRSLSRAAQRPGGIEQRRLQPGRIDS